MVQDIFDIDSKSSIVRQGIESRLVYDLADFDVEPFEVPEDFAKNSFSFDKETYKKAIHNAVKVILPKEGKINDDDYGHLYTCTYEAILNAFQHGNKYDPLKQVKVGHKFTPEHAHIVVMDQGGKLHPSFVSFIVKNRQSISKDHVANFYKFSGLNDNNGVNNGTGTYFTHIYSDKVNYYKSKENGLVISIQKALKNEDSLL
ncbi:MAG: ATP-binding protein [Candidatus Nanoarchaeia archaeon]|nr:ATP-binding protein [Candidatus Nanoarchaeia archaeon]